MSENHTNEALGSSSAANRVLTHGGACFVTRIVGALLRIATLPLYTARLTPAEYGMVASATATAELAGLLMGMRVDAAFALYFFDCDGDKTKTKRLFSSCFLFMSGMGLLIYLVAVLYVTVFGGGRIPERLVVPLVVALAAPLFYQCSLLSYAFVRNTQSLWGMVALPLLGALVPPMVALFLIYLVNVGGMALLLGNLLGAVCQFVLALWIARRAGLLCFCMDVAALKPCVTYGLIQLPTLGASWIFTVSDRLVLSAYSGLAVTGVYSVAYQISQGVSFVSLSVNAIHAPLMLARLHADYEEGIRSLKPAIAGYYWLLSTICLGASLLSQELLMLLTSESYHAGQSIMVVVVWSFFLGGQYTVFANILSFHRRFVLLAVIGIVAAGTNLVLNLIYVPVHGMHAAAWTTLVAVVLYAVLVISFATRRASPPIPWRDIGLTTAINGGLLIAVWLLTAWIPSVPMRVVLKVGACLLSVAVCWGLDIARLRQSVVPAAVQVLQQFMERATKRQRSRA